MLSGSQRLKELKKFLEKDATERKLSFIKRFVILVALYGTLIAYITHALLQHGFTIQRILGWGVLYYFIREELPDIIKSAHRARPAR